MNSARWWRLALWPVVTLGAVVVAWSYSIAATHDAGDTVHYAVFWLGVLLVTAPTFVVAGSRRIGVGTRLAWLLGYAAFTFVPKLLRNPSLPLYYDEVAHWRQSADLTASGTLYQPNALISIIADFPGLHILTAAVGATTGLSTWHSAEIVFFAAHVIALLGAVSLGEAVFGSLRAGAIVGLFYSLNSSFLYFDTEFGYESLGMVFFIWCLACVGWMYRARTRRARLAWTAAAALLGIAVVPVHHLSSLFLFLALAFVTVAALLTRHSRETQQEAHGPLWEKLLVLGLLAGMIVLWFTAAAPHTATYLSPYFQGGFSQLGRLWSGTGNGRTLYSASSNPKYEQLFAFVAPALVGLLALAGILGFLRRRRRAAAGADYAVWSPMRIGLSAYGLLYFLALPFILTASGAEGARRSWGFSYLGLAVLVTPVVLALLDSPRWTGTVRRRRAVGTASVCAGCVVLIGNVSAGLDGDYRFPGPYVFGSDTRSVTPEGVAAAQWLARSVGGRQKILADRYAGLLFVRDAASWPATPSPGFPAYDLYFSEGKPSDALVAELATSGYTYMIIDDRMATQQPAQGEYFGPGEPNHPPTPGALSQYTHDPWTTLVYQSDHYSIYRFDFAAIDAHVTGSTP
ncbi:hypothetical protein KDL01_26480 [Actinospica durhamensis]|uniref:Uncharacterized protein n=1 Tax=Actinospica durhamensis TaxID=1508375 RepID=A0A941EUT4_9ACTN|nr:hypothetical protein [Actinospica durhamensis]MBR7836853.1 hypothetical protein [Actinospica durhamensis]